MKTWNQFLSEMAPTGQTPQPGQAQQQQQQKPQTPGQPSGEFQLKDAQGKPLGSRRPNGAWTDASGQPIPLVVAQRYEQMWANMQRQAQIQATTQQQPR